jgi:hypothetical protein
MPLHLRGALVLPKMVWCRVSQPVVVIAACFPPGNSPGWKNQTESSRKTWLYLPKSLPRIAVACCPYDPLAVHDKAHHNRTHNTALFENILLIIGRKSINPTQSKIVVLSR